MPDSMLSSQQPQGCGDHSCAVARPAGMGTNGRCRCEIREVRAALLWYRARVRELELQIAGAKKSEC